jgi:hypothetical protein
MIIPEIIPRKYDPAMSGYDRFIISTHTYGGWYHQNNNKIGIWGEHSPRETVNTINHEYIHHIVFTLLCQDNLDRARLACSELDQPSLTDIMELDYKEIEQ